MFHASTKRITLAAASGLLAFALIAVPTSPALFELGEQLERSRPVTILAAEDALTQSVADDLAEVAQRAGVRVDRATVGTADALLDGIRKSRADFLIVVAHGTPATGLTLGATTASREAILDALSHTRAKEVFFAACALDLPETVGNVRVHSYETAVDARVATLDAVQEWSGIYEDATVINDGFLPAFFDLLDKRGGVPAYAQRLDSPVEPLAHVERCPAGDPFCIWREQARDVCLNPELAREHKEWRCQDHSVEEEAAQRAQAEEGTSADTQGDASFFDASWEQLERMGLVQLKRDEEFKGKSWRWLLIVGDPQASSASGMSKACVRVAGLIDVLVPGYGITREMLFDGLAKANKRKVPVAVEMQADWLALYLCGGVYAGLLKDGSVQGSGHLEAQISITNHKIHFKFGRGFFAVTVTASAWTGIVLNADATVARAPSGEVRVSLELYLDFVTHFSLGHKYGGFDTRLWGPELASWKFTPGGASASASHAGPDADVAGQTSGLEGYEVTRHAALLALAPAHVEALKRDAHKRAILEARLGIPLDRVPEGTVVDLSDPVFYDLFIAGDGPAPDAEVRLPGGVVPGGGVRKKIGGMQTFDGTSCAPVFTIKLVTQCWPGQEETRDLASPATTPSGQPTCAPSWVPELKACMETEGGAPTRVYLVADRPHVDLNATLTPILEERVWPVADPYCRALLPDHLGGVWIGAKDVCPYGSAARLCAVFASWVDAHTGYLGWPNWACERYRMAMSGEGLVTDKSYRFQVATAVVGLGDEQWSLGVDLCLNNNLPALGKDNLPCYPGSGGAVGADAPLDVPVEQYYRTKIDQYYRSIGSIDGQGDELEGWACAALGIESCAAGE